MVLKPGMADNKCRRVSACVCRGLQRGIADRAGGAVGGVGGRKMKTQGGNRGAILIEGGGYGCEGGRR